MYVYHGTGANYSANGYAGNHVLAFHEADIRPTERLWIRQTDDPISEILNPMS